MNTSIVEGNLTAAPVAGDTKGEKPTRYAFFTVAHNRKFTDKAGQKKEHTAFIKCVAYGRLAEIIEEFGKKGKHILVRGYLNNNDNEYKEVKMQETMIVIEEVKFC